MEYNALGLHARRGGCGGDRPGLHRSAGVFADVAITIMDAELLSVGTELLIGQVVDTNAAYLGQKLAEAGIDVRLKTTVGDDLGLVSWAVSEALGRYPLAISTGGLGPTHDDLTGEAIARATGRKLQLHAPSFERICAFLERVGYGASAGEPLRKQAMVPRGATVIENPLGTAPGFILESRGSSLVALPGVPAEMRAMMEATVLPWLSERRGHDGSLRSRTLRFVGVGESQLSERLRPVVEAPGQVEIAFLPEPGEVRLRLTARAGTAEDAERTLADVGRQIADLTGEWLTSADDEPLEAVIARVLRERGATLALAESCTGGLIGDRITSIPGSSEYLLLDVVAYSNEAKIRLLQVRQETLAVHGAVSVQAAAEMASGARACAGATYGVSATGIAGPGGGSEAKPVGLAYVGLSGPRGEVVEEHQSPGDRRAVKARTAQAALDLLRRQLQKEGR
jgi:nicotinamide-nucleotide amidase